MNLEVKVLNKMNETLYDYGVYPLENFLHQFTVKEIEHIFSRQIQMTEMIINYNSQKLIIRIDRKADK